MDMNTEIQEAETRHSRLYAELLAVVNRFAGGLGQQAVEIIDGTEVHLTTRYMTRDGQTHVITQKVALNYTIT
jgi:hypothetical protein